MTYPLKWLAAITTGVYAGLFAAVVKFAHGKFISDLDVFWVASWMMIHKDHGATSAYVEQSLRQTLIHVVGQNIQGRFGWFYPPHYYLVIAPLALLPLYLPAFLAWFSATFMVFRYAVGKLVPFFSGFEWSLYLIIVPSAAFMMNALRGQNGMLISGLAIMALIQIFMIKTPTRKNDWSLALLLCGISIKPHMGLIFPFIMAYQKRWAAMVITAVMIPATVLLACAVLGGTDVLRSYINSLSVASGFLESNGHQSDYWSHAGSFYAFARGLGANNALGYGLHICAALAALWLGYGVIKKGDARHQIAASLVVMTLLSPYIMEYDCLGVSVAVALVWRDITSVRDKVLAVLVLQISCFTIFFSPVTLLPLANMAFLVWLYLQKDGVLDARSLVGDHCLQETLNQG